MSRSRIDRRRFLQGSLSSLAGLALAASGRSSEARAAVQGLERRRHLINIVVWGGIDSLWWHNAVRFSEIRGIDGTARTPGGLVEGDAFRDPSDILSGFANFRTPQPGESFWETRFPDAFARPFPGTSGRQHVGPGFAKWTDAELSRLLIWRGLQGEGGHRIGNRIIQAGTSGESSPCFSPLIAQALAKDRVRRLHYVQLADSPAELFNHAGPLTGLARPSLIEDAIAWGKLTQPRAGDLEGERRALLEGAIRELSASVAGFKRRASPALFEALRQSFDSAISIGNSAYSTRADFLATVARYEQAIRDELAGHPFYAWFPRGRVFPAGEDATATRAYQQLAFRFALAEFLVVHDESAVVDLPAIPLDFHQRADTECVTVLAIMACFRKLIEGLRSAGLPDGTNLLDRTTIIMHTEFDRNPMLSGSTSALNRAGSEHWEPMASLLMAGMGVQGGRIVGDFQRGPNGLYAASGFSNIRPYYPLPVDPATGVPTSGPGGRGYSIRSIYSTLLSIFDVASPISADPALPAVRKPTTI